MDRSNITVTAINGVATTFPSSQGAAGTVVDERWSGELKLQSDRYIQRKDGVRVEGGWHDFRHQRIRDRVYPNHPNSTLYFPDGSYLGHNNTTTTAGFLINAWSGTSACRAARNSCAIPLLLRAAGGVSVQSSSNVTFENLDVAYVNQASLLPLARTNAVGDGILIQGCTNITLRGHLDRSFNRPRHLDTGSVNVKVLGARVDTPTADGVHFENSTGDASDLYLNGTGDDSLASTNVPARRIVGYARRISSARRRKRAASRLWTAVSSKRPISTSRYLPWTAWRR